MNLELTGRERRLLTESLFNQIVRVDKLKNTFEDDDAELFKYYTNEKIELELLFGKVKIYIW
jgi:hypothetical protein